MQYLKIKDIEIPIDIKIYKNSKSVKIYFKGNTLKVTKPKRVAINIVMNILKKEEEKLYSKYIKILDSKVSSAKQWNTGETFYYKGKEFDIIRKIQKENKAFVNLDIVQNKLIIVVPEGINQQQLKNRVDKLIKQLLKTNTELIIKERLPYWSKITQISYNQVKIRDAITRYGSCMPDKKNLYFSSRLIMLPENIVDAIIVHELCHMKYKYHNTDFYNLVSTFIPNYKEIDKWLKINGKMIMF